MHYQIIKLSKFVAILMVINKNRASVIEDATELLVRWSHYLCSGLHYICSMPTDIVLVVKSTTFVSRIAKFDSNIQ